jgi:hypothetical protein
MKYPYMKLKVQWLVRWYAEVSCTTCPSLTARRRKLIKDRCKELNWLTFNKKRGIASFLSTEDQNSKTVKVLARPVKLETFKKHDKSFQHQEN